MATGHDNVTRCITAIFVELCSQQTLSIQLSPQTDNRSSSHWNTCHYNENNGRLIILTPLTITITLRRGTWTATICCPQIAYKNLGSLVEVYQASSVHWSVSEACPWNTDTWSKNTIESFWTNHVVDSYLGYAGVLIAPTSPHFFLQQSPCSLRVRGILNSTKKRFN